MVSVVVVAVFVLWGSHFHLPQCDAFKILPAGDGSLTHQQITKQAFLRKTAAVCRDAAAARGLDFTLPINSKLTSTTVHRACSISFSSLLKLSTFDMVIILASLSNAAVDGKLGSTAHHFDNEDFENGRNIITQGIASIKHHMEKGSYFRARQHLGSVCHTLQDFYSHSNWVELGSSAPFITLIKPELPLNNLAGSNTKTCKSCVGHDCRDNILPEVLQQKILTSGYFHWWSSKKPAGKCSHGGFLDRTSFKDPTGGINKDDLSSSHGYLHLRAAEMAINATMELLEDIRLATGDTAFLKLMGLKQTSILAFVIDITSSLSNYITDVIRVTFNIMNSRRGTSEEPSEYILVPFNDQKSGPLIRTGNVEEFKEHINSLSASVALNFSDMCLSGLLLALTKAPPSSDIFVFTDASAKDSGLKNAIEATIEQTKSTVNVLLASSSSHSRNDISSRSLPQSDVQLYRELAFASGGQTIEITNTLLSQDTITDVITFGLVTVLQVERSSAMAEIFSFVLDSSLSNVMVYVSGDAPVFTLFSPTGVSQSDSVADGPLGNVLIVGNLKRLKLNSTNQTGKWKISINSTSSCTLKVIGQSSVDILVDFVEMFEGGHGDSWGQSFTRPLIGQNATLFVSVTGGGSVTVTDVLLVGVSGSDVVNGSIKAVGATDFLVNVDRIPEGAFVVQLKGQLNDSSTISPFQRQSPTQQKGSRITVTAQSQNMIQAGVPLSLNFSVSSSSPAGNYTIRVWTDQGFSVSVPSSLVLSAGGSAQGIVTLTAPSDTESGTDVTLTIEAEAPGSSDLNYSTLRLTVSSASAVFSRCYSLSLALSLFWLFISHFV